MRHVFALANAFKEGDLLVGGTRDDRVREDARREVKAMRIGDIRRAVFVDDGVTAALERDRDRRYDATLDSMTIDRLKDTLLGDAAAAWAQEHRDAIASEVTAAVVKVMTGEELARVAATLFNPHPGPGVTIGSARHFGSRIQPNSPGDDEEEIVFSVLEGLTHGCGDVIIGLNPAADELETIVRLEELLARIVARLALPTRFCVLSDLMKQQRAARRTRVDVGFQSLAGTSRALVGMAGLDADGLLDVARTFPALYFETGQGSAVTNGHAEGVDMVTLEARAYGLARHVHRRTGAWMIVNDVAGFIGPEVFRTTEQLERACFEDLVMAKLHGLTMGLDVCATFHMGVSPAELRALTGRIVERGAPAYLMAVAGNADPMLGYLTTSFRDHDWLRASTGRETTAAMARWLAAHGDSRVSALYARYAQAGGDHRTQSALEEEGARKLAELRERGFDLGAPASWSDERLSAIYEHARHALSAMLDAAVVRDVCTAPVLVETEAVDRDDYLAHPPAGERLRAADAHRLRSRRGGRPRGAVQIVISDGLNANALNQQLRHLLPAVRRQLSDAGVGLEAEDIIVRNGRVRAGYHIGQLLDCDVVVHVIGERPGTGLNTVSAYLTYGRDDAGRARWDPQMDHSWTNAVCGIHAKGKTPELAAAEIARTVVRMLERRRSGVAL